MNQSDCFFFPSSSAKSIIVCYIHLDTVMKSPPHRSPYRGLQKSLFVTIVVFLDPYSMHTVRNPNAKDVTIACEQQ